MSFINEIKSRYKGGNIVEKLIYINIAVFVITLLSKVFFKLYKNNTNYIMEWFSLRPYASELLVKPWSIISYGFLHDGFIHIIFNLIALYYIGNLFIQYFTQKQLLNFYILGTLFGGLLFVLSYNYFPLFEDRFVPLVGASAGISAIFIGIATYMPNYQLKIPLIGFIKVWHLAAIWVGFDVLGLIGNNAGGNFAHLGGSLFGFLYVYKASNKELNLWGTFSSWFEKKEKPLKTVHKSGKKKQSTVKNNTPNQQQIDAILDKISKSGYDTLTKSEKEFLFKQGKR
ncbi:rhomboid family intramembrane serine protease [Polaribacter cellanae]|uniref:Rhomboid family intramembrane serine protease n=1 Tax=Polaribacter cellanae TaxID=2818493 RepID=A0A975CT07_9FLAO|nr:rhomboid family intramembrane serine protease [Polaribacter cellanae]QTE23472.1 rhomboid family intramembrane serine protease [Polaribacter cellanae]